MKKTTTMLMCLLVLLLMAACKNTPPGTTGTETSAEITSSASAESTATYDTSATSETSTETAEPTTGTAEPTTAEETTAATAESTSTAAPTIAPTTTVSMYTSYAHMVSYDPARGFADFDYFNILRGQDAIDYLVGHEGYEQAEAEALVNDFADSEFVEQNDNPLLRTIDLRDIDLMLMYYPDGTMVTGAMPVDSELIDLYNLYHVDPDLVLDSFFYFVHVTGGNVTMVEQVYWP